MAKNGLSSLQTALSSVKLTRQRSPPTRSPPSGRRSPRCRTRCLSLDTADQGREGPACPDRGRDGRLTAHASEELGQRSGERRIRQMSVTDSSAVATGSGQRTETQATRWEMRIAAAGPGRWHRFSRLGSLREDHRSPDLGEPLVRSRGVRACGAGSQFRPGALGRGGPDSPIDSINSSSASAALSALGSGMLAFTGFVTSVILMVVQFGTSEFSPRFVAWINRDRTLRFALSTFSATFLFALVSTAQIGRGNANVRADQDAHRRAAPDALSILMFLLLIDRTSNGLRVASVVQAVDSAAREVFDAVYPDSASDAAAAQTDGAITGWAHPGSDGFGRRRGPGRGGARPDRVRGPRPEIRRCHPARAGHRRSCPGRRHAAQRLRAARAARAAAAPRCRAGGRADTR